jgi:4'-phosphopantetheinyl transferase
VTGSVAALAPGACQVWWGSTADLRPWHDALLAPADLERRARLRRVADRQRLTVGVALVRLVVGAGVGVPPAQLEIDRTCPECGGQHGKPRLPTAPDVHFSVSHSGGCVAVAVLRGSPVGVDVEEVGRFDAGELDAMAGHTLAPEERAELARQPAEDRARAFSTYWARKEAVVKATGVGIATSLDQLVVSPPSSPPRVLRWEAQSERLSLHVLHPPPGLVAALAVVGEAPTDVVERSAAPILTVPVPQEG